MSLLSGGVAQPARRSLSRDDLYLATLAVGVANGLFATAQKSSLTNGVLAAAGATFDVSAIVWIATSTALWLGAMAKTDARAPNRLDWALIIVANALVLLPYGPLAWIAVTLTAARIITLKAAEDRIARAAWILIAVSVPMFWSKLLFVFLADIVLGFDAVLAASILGTARSGNLVGFADGSGVFQIYPACSSVVGISLSMVLWMTAIKGLGRRWTLQDGLWCILGASLVAATNVARLALIGWFPARFELIHGSVGNHVAGWLAIVVMAGACAIGLRRELFVVGVQS